MGDEVSKDSTEAVRRFGPSLTRFSIAGRYWHLRELPIGRVKKLALMISNAFDRLREKIAGNGSIEGMELSTLLDGYSDSIFAEVETIWNWLFAWGAEGAQEKYEPATAEWLQDNITMSMFGDIIKEIAHQNRMDWLIPFFRSRLTGALQAALAAGVAAPRSG